MARFSMLGFPTEIHLSFLIVVLLLFDAGFSGVGVALFTGAMLASVVLHELGHAVTARRFGAEVLGIRIYALGGVTVWSDARAAVEGWRRFMVAASGSAGGIVLGLILFGMVRLGLLGESGLQIIRAPWDVSIGFADLAGEYLVFFVGVFILVSVVWGLVNWLPIGGLDGSKMLSVILVRLLGPSGDLHARIIGVIVAIAASVWLYRRGAIFGPIILMAFSLSDLAAYRRRRPPPQVEYHDPPSEEDSV